MDKTGKPAHILSRLGVTWAVTLAAVLVFAWPRLTGVLIYERAGIFAGQLWRLWTGHLVHYTISHLFWDLLVFLAAGSWLEWIAPRLTRWFYVWAPPMISAAMLWGDPSLERYAGLSGLATGVLVLLALIQWRRDRSAPAWFWPCVLLLVAVKIAAESWAHAPLFAHFESGIQVVSLAHVAGIGCAVVAYAAAGRKVRPPGETANKGVDLSR